MTGWCLGGALSILWLEQTVSPSSKAFIRMIDGLVQPRLGGNMEDLWWTRTRIVPTVVQGRIQPHRHGHTDVEEYPHTPRVTPFVNDP